MTFSPIEAKVIITSVVFKFKEGENVHQRQLKLSGIGKFPFLSIDHEKLAFESTLVGKIETKKIELRNYSQVASLFSIEKINDDGKDNSFSLSDYSGEIKAGGTKRITVTYAPNMVGANTCT